MTLVSPDAVQPSEMRLVRHPSMTELDELSINTIRCLAMDAVQKAKSGHPGMPMGMAPAAYILWTEYLKHNPSNPSWVNRDRFVLSAGHGCMLQYALLHLTGYDLPLEDIKNFRQWGSRAPGHPEYGRTPGVEVTTGPLGQGLANSVGMAIAEKYLAQRFNTQNRAILFRPLPRPRHRRSLHLRVRRRRLSHGRNFPRGVLARRPSALEQPHRPVR